MDKIKVAVLGGTGTVGQRYVQLLEGHPWFELSEICASESSAGKRYADAVRGRWKISADVPEYAADIAVKECIPELDAVALLSGLDSSVAGDIEEMYANRGYIVSSNSRNHRMDPDVPLLIAEVNPEHVKAVEKQMERRKNSGFIITNPNCSTIGLAIPLKALYDEFSIGKVNVTTMQAISGAGYPGMSAFDMVDNVHPCIPGEEEKIQTETQKILGCYDDGFIYADIEIAASCNRVFVLDGHKEDVFIEIGGDPDIEHVQKTLENFRSVPQDLGLPSAPEKPIIIRHEQDRPQPRYDRNAGNGMSVVVGRVRKAPTGDYVFECLSHNTIRGAAGCSILNLELLKSCGYVGV